MPDDRPVRARLSRPPGSGYRVRLLGDFDLREVEAIDGRSFVRPMSSQPLKEFLEGHGTVAAVAEHAGWTASRVVGYMVCAFGPKRVNLLRLAVDPPARRRGVGRLLLARLDEAASSRRPWLRAEARLSEWPGLLFLKAAGWRAVGCDTDAYPADDAGSGDDRIVMVRRAWSAKKAGGA